MASKNSKNTTKKAAGAGKLADSAATESMSLNQWLSSVKNHAAEVAAAGEPVGACIVTNPHTGTNVCILVDAKTCKSLKGTFIGGPCGS